MKQRRITLLTWLLLFHLAMGVSIFAEEPVKVTGNSIKGDTEKKITYIEGNVKIVQGSDVIFGDWARVDLDNKLLYLENQVVFKSADLTIEAWILDYNMKKKNGTFQKEVVLKRLEKKDKAKGDNKDPFTLYADELYFESNTKNFSAFHGRIEHKEFNGTADRIEYHDKLQQLTLIGNSYLKRPEGEEVRGEQTKINLKDKSFIVEKNVTINFDVDDDEDQEDDKERKKDKS